VATGGVLEDVIKTGAAAEAACRAVTDLLNQQSRQKSENAAFLQKNAHK
jgi:hypothetical protein